LQCLPLSFIPGLIYWWMERISRLHSRTSDQNLEIVPNFQDVHSLMRRSWLALESRSEEKFCATTGGTVSEVQESLDLEDLGRIATCTEILQSAWDHSRRCISVDLRSPGVLGRDSRAHSQLWSFLPGQGSTFQGSRP